MAGNKRFAGLFFGAWVPGSIVIIVVCTWGLTEVSLGFTSHDWDRTGYWIAFWAALFSGAIVTVPIGIAVWGKLHTWEEQAEDAARRRDWKALKEHIKVLLSQADVLGFQTPWDGVPYHVHRLAAIVEDKPLPEWRDRIGDNDPCFDALEAFRARYLDFEGAAQIAEHWIGPRFHTLRRVRPDAPPTTLTQMQKLMYFLMDGKAKPEDRTRAGLWVLPQKNNARMDLLSLNYEQVNEAERMAAEATTYKEIVYWRDDYAERQTAVMDAVQHLRTILKVPMSRQSPGSFDFSLQGHLTLSRHEGISASATIDHATPDEPSDTAVSDRNAATASPHDHTDSRSAP